MSWAISDYQLHVAEEPAAGLRAGSEGRRGYSSGHRGRAKSHSSVMTLFGTRDFLLTKIIRDKHRRQSTGIRKYQYLNFLVGKLTHRHAGIYSKATT